MKDNDESNSNKGLFSSAQVTVRVKPCPQETKIVISKVRNKPKLVKMCDKSFSFDNIKWGSESQEQVYKAAAYPFVEKALDGYSATIFAFGQTGSGKSYTMGSLKPTMRTWRTSGLIQRCLKHIFEQTGVEVLATFVEVYNEELHDLLDTGAPIITCRDEKIDSKMEKIASLTEGMSLVRKALEQRQERVISSNSSTSQSHVVLTLYLTVDHGDYSVVSKLNLVDLAGSRIIEHRGFPSNEPLGIKHCINEGLSALDRVISAMSTAKDLAPILCTGSLLTRILKDSFDAKCQISLVVCLSPNFSDYNENLKVLQFAERLKLIEIHPTRSDVTRCDNCFADQLKATTQQLSELLSPVSNDTEIFKQQQNKHNVVKTAADSRIKDCTVIINRSNIDFDKDQKIQQLKENIAPINTHNVKTNVQSTQELSTGDEAAISLASTVSINEMLTQSFQEISTETCSTSSKRCNCETNSEDNIPKSDSEWLAMQNIKLELEYSEIPLECQDQCSNFGCNFLNGPNDHGKFKRQSNDSDRKIKHSKHQVETQPCSTPQDVSSSDQFYDKPGTSYAKTNQMERMNAVLKSNLLKSSNERGPEVRRFHETGSSQVNIHHSNKFLKTDQKRLPVPVRPDQTFYEYKRESLEYNDHENDENLKLSDLKNMERTHRANILRILNSGNPKQLATLPRIGSKTAIIICNYRLFNGKFRSLKDLMNIPAWSKALRSRFFEANHLSFE